MPTMSLPRRDFRTRSLSATGCEARASHTREGFQIILDQTGADHLLSLLAGDTVAS